MYIVSTYGQTAKKGTPNYPLPFDIVSGGVLGYSLRLIRAAYTGPLIKVQRSSDNAQLDIYPLASGALDLGTLMTFAGSSTCYVIKWYDQSTRAEHLENLYTPNCPQVIIAGVLQTENGKPALYFSGTTGFWKNTNSSYLSAGFTNFHVVRNKGMPGNNSWMEISISVDEGYDSPSYSNYPFPFTMSYLSFGVGSDVLPVGYGGPYPQSTTFDTANSTITIGYTTGKLSQPARMCIDSSGNIYCVNHAAYRKIEKFNSSGVPQMSFTIPSGAGAGEASSIGGIGVQPNGNIIVSNPGQGKFLVFNSSGVFQNEYCTYGSGTNQLKNPSQIAVLSNGDFYIADAGNNRIVKFNGSTYSQSAAYGSSGTGNGQFASPFGVAVDSSGNIFVLDTNNRRVQKLNSSGIYQTEIGSFGTGNGQFNYAQAIACDASGNVYVADTGNRRIQKLSNSLVYVSKFGTAGSGDTQFLLPQGIALDSSGNILVSDTNLNKIKKFNSSFAYQIEYGVNLYEDLANYSWGCNASTKAFTSKRHGQSLVSGTAAYYLTANSTDNNYIAIGVMQEGNGSNFIGSISELLTFNSRVSDTNWNTLDANQTSYWGIV